MRFRVSFIMDMDVVEEVTDDDLDGIKDFIFDSLDTSAISISGIHVEVEKED
jgi:hypothetical protein